MINTNQDDPRLLQTIIGQLTAQHYIYQQQIAGLQEQNANMTDVLKQMYQFRSMPPQWFDGTGTTPGDPNGVSPDYNGWWFKEWTPKRVNKLVSVLGKEWFKDKTVLELACGYGNASRSLRQYSTKHTTMTDGLQANVDELIKRQTGDVDVLLLDQDTNWNLDKVFDLVIHWGIFYHLDNWRRDLTTAIQHTRKVICIEGLVLASLDPNEEIKQNEVGWFDGAVNGIGTQTTATAIEQVLTDNDMVFKRYDDSDLNVENKFVYDWNVKTRDIHNEESRRFWIAHKKGENINL